MGEGSLCEGGSKICHTAMFEKKVVNAIKAISYWKVPRPDFLKIFWSELLRIAHGASAEYSVGSLSELVIYLVHMAPWKNCHISARLSFLTKTDQLHAYLPSFKKNGIHFVIKRTIIPPEILEGCSKGLMTCNDQAIWDFGIIIWPTKRKSV